MEGLFPFVGVEESQSGIPWPVLSGADPSSPEPSFRGTLLEAMGRPAGPITLSDASARAGPSSSALPIMEVLGERRPIGTVLNPFAGANRSRFEGSSPLGFAPDSGDAAETEQHPLVGDGSLRVTVPGGWGVLDVLEPVAGNEPLALPVRQAEAV